MQVRLYYQLTLRDRNGKVVRRYRRRRAHSFVQQYMQHLHCFISNANEASVADTGNTARTLVRPAGAAAPMMAMGAGAGTTLVGMRVGTGTTAVAMTDYALETPIAHGTGSGQLSHSAETIGAYSQSGSDAEFQITRTFTNSSGATITVTETGLYVQSNTTAGAQYFLIVRDVLPASVDVPDGQSLAVDYTIKISV